MLVSKLKYPEHEFGLPIFGVADSSESGIHEYRIVPFNLFKICRSFARITLKHDTSARFLALAKFVPLFACAQFLYGMQSWGDTLGSMNAKLMCL